MPVTAVVQLDKPSQAAPRPDQFEVLAEVTLDDPRLSRLTAPAGRRPYDKLLHLLSRCLAWGLSGQLSEVQVAGLNRYCDSQGTFLPAGPVLWLMQHTDNPGDALLLASLLHAFPQKACAAGSQRRLIPAVVMRQVASFGEWLFTCLLFGRSCIHQDLRREQRRPGAWLGALLPGWLRRAWRLGPVLPPRPLSTGAETARRRANLRVLARAAQRSMALGAGVVLFPEGRVNGTGVLHILATGAVEAFQCACDGGQALKVPVGLAYEVLDCQQPRAILNLGRGLVLVRPPAGAGAACRRPLRRDLVAALTGQGIVTLSGLLGDLFLGQGAAAAPLPVGLELPQMVVYVDCVVGLVRRAQAQPGGALAEFVVDAALDRPGRTWPERAWQGLRARGYLDGAGRIDRLRLLRDDQVPKFYGLPAALHRHNPLLYYGNRTAQAAAWVPEYRAILDAAAIALRCLSAPVPRPPASRVPYPRPRSRRDPATTGSSAIAILCQPPADLATMPGQRRGAGVLGASAWPDARHR